MRMTTSSDVWRSFFARWAPDEAITARAKRWRVPSPSRRLLADRVYLRLPHVSDWQEWARLRRESRAFLVPWEPAWAPDALSRSSFRRRLRQQKLGWREDDCYSFLIFERDGDQLVGGVSLSNVRRGVSQAGSLGYWMSEHYAGRGYMTEAVQRVVQFAFNDLRLHRVEAACLPSNEASQAVLDKCGFVQEGVAAGYLRINGRWQDHLLFAVIADRPSIASGSRVSREA